MGHLNLNRAIVNYRRHKPLRVYQDWASLRGDERALGISRQTVAHWIKTTVQRLPHFKVSVDSAEEGDSLELYEMWSFVRIKKQKRWLWITLCRRTRQVVVFVLGDRSEDTCRRLFNKLPEQYQSCHSYSDYWKAYAVVFTKNTHQ